MNALVFPVLNLNLLADLSLDLSTLSFSELIIMVFVVLELIVVFVALVALVIVRSRAMRNEVAIDSARRNLTDSLATIGPGGNPGSDAKALAAVAALSRDHARRLLTELAEQAGPGGSRVLEDLYAKGNLAAEARANAASRPWERLRVIREARALSDPARLLSGLVRDSVADVRLGAFEALCTLGRADEALVAIAALSQDGRLNRMRVIDALSTSTPLPEKALIHMISADQPEIRQIVVATLGLARLRGGLPAIVNAVTDPDAEVRIQALRALRELNDTSVLPTTLAALHDDRWEVRSEAARTCAALGHGGAAESIAKLLDDEAEWVRHNASIALTRCGPAGIAALRSAAARGNESASSALAEARMAMTETQASARPAPA